MQSTGGLGGRFDGGWMLHCKGVPSPGRPAGVDCGRLLSPERHEVLARGAFQARDPQETGPVALFVTCIWRAHPSESLPVEEGEPLPAGRDDTHM